MRQHIHPHTKVIFHFYPISPTLFHPLGLPNILNLTKNIFHFHCTSNRHLNRKTLIDQHFYAPQISPLSPYSSLNHPLTLDTYSFTRYTVNITQPRGCILHQKILESLVPHRIYRYKDNRSR